MDIPDAPCMPFRSQVLLVCGSAPLLLSSEKQAEIKKNLKKYASSFSEKIVKLIKMERTKWKAKYEEWMAKSKAAKWGVKIQPQENGYRHENEEDYRCAQSKQRLSQGEGGDYYIMLLLASVEERTTV